MVVWCAKSKVFIFFRQQCFKFYRGKISAFSKFSDFWLQYIITSEQDITCLLMLSHEFSRSIRKKRLHLLVLKKIKFLFARRAHAILILFWKTPLVQVASKLSSKSCDYCTYKTQQFLDKNRKRFVLGEHEKSVEGKWAETQFSLCF